MAAQKNHGVTLAQVRRWPPTVNVEDAAEALGISRATLYAALAEGTAPVQVVRVRRRMRVLTASLIDTLEGNGDRAASA